MYRKELHVLRLAAVVAALACLAVAANAQSVANSHGNISYGFGINANSGGTAADLQVDDLGLVVYNIYDHNNSLYASLVGNANVSAYIDAGTSFDPGGWTGVAGAGSHADASPNGSAIGSSGAQQNLQLTNNGSLTITIDTFCFANITGDASVVGTVDANNFAMVDTYGGVYEVNLTTFASSNPYVHLHGDSTGITTDTFNGFGLLGGDLYNDNYSFDIAPGESHLLAFYTSGLSNVSAAVPDPTTIVPMGIGLVGLLARRRRKVA